MTRAYILTVSAATIATIAILVVLGFLPTSAFLVAYAFHAGYVCFYNARIIQEERCRPRPLSVAYKVMLERDDSGWKAMDGSDQPKGATE